MAFFEKFGESLVQSLFPNYFFGGIATVIGTTLLAKTLRASGKPYLVGATKEAIAFKTWLSASFAEGKEFCEDVAAEAKHKYKAEVDQKLQILQKQQEILQKIKATL